MEHLETTRMLTMCKPASNPYSASECADSLARAEALEHEITDLCAQINAANYRLLQRETGTDLFTEISSADRQEGFLDFTGKSQYNPLIKLSFMI